MHTLNRLGLSRPPLEVAHCAALCIRLMLLPTVRLGHYCRCYWESRDREESRLCVYARELLVAMRAKRAQHLHLSLCSTRPVKVSRCIGYCQTASKAAGPTLKMAASLVKLLLCLKQCSHLIGPSSDAGSAWRIGQRLTFGTRLCSRWQRQG